MAPPAGSHWSARCRPLMGRAEIPARGVDRSPRLILIGYDEQFTRPALAAHWPAEWGGCAPLPGGGGGPCVGAALLWRPALRWRWGLPCRGRSRSGRGSWRGSLGGCGDSETEREAHGPRTAFPAPGQVYVCSSLPVLCRLRRHLRLCVACGCAGPLVPLKCCLCSPPAAPGAAGRPVFHAIRTCQAICSGFLSKNLQNLKCKTATEETSRLEARW